MMDQEKPRTLFDVFAQTQETFEDAKKKSSEESSKRATYFRFAKDGTYNVRILPLAPVPDGEGGYLPMERKGYEYPLRSLMLKIEDSSKSGKPSMTYVTVCNVKYSLKEIESDLVDVYVKVACDKYADDEKLCKKLKENSFSGGLKWDSRRCMYVIDLDNPGDGIQLMQLSYAQYKDLEERKLNLWGKLNKNGRKVPCPISSINAAYPVEIIRKTENNKPSYSFNIDTVADKNVLDEETLERLLAMPRLPEQIYRYTRYQLEATIVYLTQLDEKFNIDVMESEEVQNCIAQIKMLLPADDTSHFALNKKEDDASDNEANTIDALWSRSDALDKAGLDDETEEGQDLRASIMDFIDANDLDVKITRKKTNYDILNEIENELKGGKTQPDSAQPSKAQPVEDDEYEYDDDEPASSPVEDDEPAPSTSRRSRNDDTNEPAARSERRTSRAPRRRAQ